MTNKKIISAIKKFTLAINELSPEFTSEKMIEIFKGIENGLMEDQILIYADPKFDQYQMEQIRLGLEKGLNVGVYAIPSFDYPRMREIRYGLEKGLDVSIYSYWYFSEQQMEQIRWGLEKGLDVSIYAKPCFHEYEMEQIREGLEEELSRK